MEDDLSRKIMQNVQLATCLEPLAEKIYATTRTKDSTPKTKLEHFISSGINFGWSFYDLSERIKDKGYKQPEYIFDISLRAQNEALRFRSGGKVVFGHCIFFPLIITSQLVNKTYEPEEILYGVKDVLKKTSKEDVNFFREVLKKNFSLPEGRGRVLQFGEIFVIDESYSSSPRSVSKAARVLSTFEQYSEQLVFIVGDMANAGINVEQQHLNMGYFLSALPISHIITVGEYAKFIAKGASLIKASGKTIHSVNTTDEVLHILKEQLPDKAVVGIKGVGSVAAHRISRYLAEANPA